MKKSGGWLFMHCMQHYTITALMPENNCAVSRNTSYTSLLPSAPKTLAVCFTYRCQMQALLLHCFSTCSKGLFVKFLLLGIYTLWKKKTQTVQVCAADRKMQSASLPLACHFSFSVCYCVNQISFNMKAQSIPIIQPDCIRKSSVKMCLTVSTFAIVEQRRPSDYARSWSSIWF